MRTTITDEARGEAEEGQLLAQEGDLRRMRKWLPVAAVGLAVLWGSCLFFDLYELPVRAGVFIVGMVSMHAVICDVKLRRIRRDVGQRGVAVAEEDLNRR
jgi:hypothetical protein